MMAEKDFCNLKVQSSSENSSSMTTWTKEESGNRLFASKNFVASEMTIDSGELDIISNARRG